MQRSYVYNGWGLTNGLLFLACTCVYLCNRLNQGKDRPHRPATFPCSRSHPLCHRQPLFCCLTQYISFACSQTSFKGIYMFVPFVLDFSLNPVFFTIIHAIPLSTVFLNCWGLLCMKLAQFVYPYWQTHRLFPVFVYYGLKLL